MSEHRAYRNTAVALAAKIAVNLLSVASGFLVVRLLSVEDFGRYSYVTSLAGIFGFVTGFGLSHYFTREMARDPARAREFLSRYLGAQVFLSLLSFAAIFAVSSFQDDPHIKHGLIAFNFSMFVTTFFNPLNSALNAVERNDLVSRQMLFQAIAQFALTLAGYFFKASLLYYLAIPLATGLLRLVHTLKDGRKLGLMARPSLELAEFAGILRSGLPFGLLMTVNILYVKFDILLFQHYQGEKTTGLYSVAGRLAYLLLFLPGTIVENLYPVFSRAQSHERAWAGRLLEKFTLYNVALCLPLVIGGALESRAFIRIFFGARYEEAAIPMAIYMAMPLCVALYAGSNLYLSARNRIWFVVKGALVALVVNVVGNIIVLARYQGLAAMIASSSTTITTEIILAATSLGFCAWTGDFRPTPGKWLRLVPPQLVLASVLCLPIPSFFARVSLGVVAYFASLWGFGVVEPEERAKIRAILGGALRSLRFGRYAADSAS